MDIKEMSRKMYSNIPEGMPVSFIDKIGLQIETRYINKENIDIWKKNNFITLTLYGDYTHINIHAEFENNEKYLGKRCFNAICLLIINNVFKLSFSLSFINYFKKILPFTIINSAFFAMPVLAFFRVVEWEWAWDFLDYRLVSFIDNNENNKKGFKKYENTNYSRDRKQKKRNREKNGKILRLSKGKQQSLISIYDRGLHIESDRLIDRIEIREQGRYQKCISNDFLIGTREDALELAKPVLKKLVKKVIHKDALVLNDYWEKKAPEEFKEIFFDRD